MRRPSAGRPNSSRPGTRRPGAGRWGARRPTPGDGAIVLVEGKFIKQKFIWKIQWSLTTIINKLLPFLFFLKIQHVEKITSIVASNRFYFFKKCLNWFQIFVHHVFPAATGLPSGTPFAQLHEVCNRLH